MSNHGYHISCKMIMEGIEVPFRSAAVSCNPNGVEMSIDVHPSDKIFDLKSKTAIQILYRDWIGPESEKKWRILGEGHFSAFGKYDTSQGGGGRGVTLMCRDFRMDVRKAPSTLLYGPNDNDLEGEIRKYMSVHGLNSTGLDKSGIISRAFGGDQGTTLKGFTEIIKFISRLPMNGREISLEPESADGQYILDVFARGVWMDSVNFAPYSQSINSRSRIDKKLVVPSNRAGFSFLSERYMRSMIQTVVFGGSMFSSVESVIMRLGAIFQAFPYSCSTPNLINIDTANEVIVSEKMRKIMQDKSRAKNGFGDMSLMNSCMLLPPLNFTAPPNCNIIFPSMMTDISWTLDRDNDITRGHFMVNKIFDEITNTAGNEIFSIAREIPTSTVDYYKDNQGGRGIGTKGLSSSAGAAKPFLSLEERFAGPNIMYGDICMYAILYGAQNAVSSKYLIGGGVSFEAAVERLRSSKNPIVQAAVAAADSDGTMTPDEVEAIKKTVNESMATAETTAQDPASGDDMALRHAYIKFMNARFAGRTVSVQMDFNPYLVTGMPAIILVPDTRKPGSSMRPLYGMLQMVRHTVASQGEATTSAVLSTVRFLDEPSKIDEDGSPVFQRDTNMNDAEFDVPSFTYMNSQYKTPSGTARVRLTPSDNPLFAYKTSTDETYKWAADLLLHDGDEKKNYHYMDATYMPHRVGAFYESMLGLDRTKHFMIGINGNKSFMFDTIHEAAYKNLIQRPEMNDYELAMRFAARNVITEEDYFIRIMGASYKFQKNKDTVVYTNKIDYVDKLIGRTADKGIVEWYGFPTDGYRICGDAIDPGLKKFVADSNKTTVTYEGALSSIIEIRPETPFIEERRKVVNDYNEEVRRRAFTAAR